MKTIEILLIPAMLFCFAGIHYAQCKMTGMNFSDATQYQPLAGDSTAKVRFRVLGNCGMCKNRIEKALKKEGVAKAQWFGENQMVEVDYVPALISEEKLHLFIAEAGHDTEKIKASGKVYDMLPGCCQYDRNPEPEKE